MLPDPTDFTEAIFKMNQISKHFSAMLRGLSQTSTNMECFSILMLMKKNSLAVVSEYVEAKVQVLQYLLRIMLYYLGLVSLLSFIHGG